MAVDAQADALDRMQRNTERKLESILDRTTELNNQRRDYYSQRRAETRADSDSERALGKINSKNAGAELTATKAKNAGDIAQARVGAQAGGAAGALTGLDESNKSLLQNEAEDQKWTEEQRVLHEQKGYDRLGDEEGKVEAGVGAEADTLAQKAAFAQYLNDNAMRRYAQDKGQNVNVNKGSTNVNAAANGSNVPKNPSTDGRSATSYGNGDGKGNGVDPMSTVGEYQQQKENEARRTGAGMSPRGKIIKETIPTRYDPKDEAANKATIERAKAALAAGGEINEADKAAVNKAIEEYEHVREWKLANPTPNQQSNQPVGVTSGLDSGNTGVQYGP